jgi:hypothetical protein
MVHQHRCSVGVLPPRRFSPLPATRRGKLPGIHNLQRHASCHIHYPKGKIQSGNKSARQEPYVWRVADDNVWLKAGVICRGLSVLSPVVLAATCCRSDCTISSGKVSPVLSPGPRSCGPAPARITLGNSINGLSQAHSVIPNEDTLIERAGNSRLPPIAGRGHLWLVQVEGRATFLWPVIGMGRVSRTPCPPNGGRSRNEHWDSDGRVGFERSVSYEYATIAKSLVISKPDMRTGWTSSPYSL